MSKDEVWMAYWSGAAGSVRCGAMCGCGEVWCVHVQTTLSTEVSEHELWCATGSPVCLCTEAVRQRVVLQCGVQVVRQDQAS